jgi:hypothetical protein
MLKTKGKQKMRKKDTNTNGLKRVTVWVNKKQWKRLANITPNGNRSEAIRCFIDRVVSKNLDISDLLKESDK